MLFFKKNDIIEMAVRMEKNGFDFYNEGLKRNDLDEQQKKIITKLRDDEEKHEKTFLALRDRVDKLDLKDEFNWDEIEYYISSLVGTHVFYDPDSAIKLAQNAENGKELLEYAIQFEKDTLLFFHSIRKYVKNQKAVDAVDKIINEEVSHVEQLKKNIIANMKNFILRQKMMDKVLIALIPITLFSIFLFGWRVLAVLLISNFFAFITEFLFVRKKRMPKVSSAAFVTGSLLALSLPPTIPLWIAAVGSVIGIAFGKMVFGGFGMNVFNPAIVGRTFIYISFPNAMTMDWLQPFSKLPGGFSVWQKLELLTSATPMNSLQNGSESVELLNLFSGIISGSAGETSALLILLAGIYLIFTKTAKWQPILSLLISFTFFTVIFYQTNPLPFVLSGGLMFGAIFMITDPVSMPKNKIAIWIYGILVGFLTVFIRKFSLFAEGFMFALLLGNTFMPIIEYGLNKARLK